MNNLMKALSSNHSLAKRQAFDRWSTKPKANKLFDLMRLLIKDRLHQSFSQMKLMFNLDRRDRMVKFFNNLEIKMKSLVLRRKKEVYDEIKQQFFNNNPWEKRVIATWALKTSQSIQHTFWRIRHQDNFGKALVSVDKSLKLKKLIEILSKSERETVYRGFSGINSYSQVQEVI